MSYISPLVNPAEYIDKVNGLSNEGITIDKGVAQAKRDAAEFASKYSSNFTLVIELKKSTEQFSDHWTTALLQTRDAASSISGWYQRFDQVFLSMIDDIASAQDAKEVITEFRSFKGEEPPSQKYKLDASPGVKSAFNQVESLVVGESDHVIKILESGEWHKAVELLKKTLPAVQSGVQAIRRALNNYATKLE